MFVFRGMCVCLMPIEISTTLTRSFLEKSCDENSICFEYLNVAQDTQHEMIVKFHTRSKSEESFVLFTDGVVSKRADCKIIDISFLISMIFKFI